MADTRKSETVSIPREWIKTIIETLDEATPSEARETISKGLHWRAQGAPLVALPALPDGELHETAADPSHVRHEPG